MTTETTAADPGNSLLGIVPAQLTATAVNTDAGQKVLLTIRTSSATVSVFLEPTDCENWARLILDAKAKVSPLTLAPAGTDLGAVQARLDAAMAKAKASVPRPS